MSGKAIPSRPKAPPPKPINPAPAAPVTGESGTDGFFRMYVANRYYRIAKFRKILKYLYMIEAAMALFRLAFHGALYIVGPQYGMSVFNKIIVPAMLAAAAVGHKVVTEPAKPTVMKRMGVSNILQIILASQLAMNFFNYFISMFKPEEMREEHANKRVHVLLARIVSERYSLPLPPLQKRLETVEGLVEMGCMVAVMACVGFGNNLWHEYKEERDKTKEAQGEAAGGRGGASEKKDK